MLTRSILGKRKRSDAAVIIQRKWRKRRATAFHSEVPKYAISLRGGSNVFPPRKRVTLQYCDMVTMTTPATAFSSVTEQYRLNWLADPQVSIGTGQVTPYGYNQYSLQYNRHCVVSAKIRVTFIPSSGASYYAGACGLNVIPSGTTPLTSGEQQSMSQFSNSGVYSQNADPVVVWLRWEAAKYFGVKDPVDDGDLSGSSGSPPNKVALLNVWVASYDGVANPVVAKVDIWYDTIFQEPKEVVPV